MTSDSENVLTVVVAEAVAAEVVAMILGDQDRGRLHHIVEIRGLPHGEDGIPHRENYHHAGIETCTSPKDEAQEVVGGRAMDATGQSRDPHPAEATVAMEEEQAGEPQVEEDR